MSLAAGGALLAAADARSDTTDELLDKLLQKGILNQQEYKELKGRKAAEVPPPAPAPAVTAAPSVGEMQSFVRMMDKGIGIHIGPVDLSFSGEINGFYVYDSPDHAGSIRADGFASTAVFGGLAGVDSRGASAVRNGLLPNNFNIDIKTVQDGINVDAHFGMYPGLNSSTAGKLGANSGGSPIALGTSGIDFRQQYLSVGTDRLGTVKFGRDIGLFGQEAILNDFTLFGVGGTGGSVAPGNTSLGRIGLGYVYTDFMPQITYTTPSFGGFQAAVGIFQPLDSFNASGLSAGSLNKHETPQVQAKFGYTMPPNGTPWKFAAWTNVVTQDLETDGSAGILEGDSQGTGWDFGAKIDYGPAEITGTGYIGSGLGTTGLFWDGVSPGYVDAAGAVHRSTERDSSGFYIQGSYTFGGVFTFSGSYGVSHLDLADTGEIPFTAPGSSYSGLLVKDNESYSFGGKYKLTTWVDLIAEFTHQTSTAHNGNQAQEDIVAAGAIAFF